MDWVMALAVGIGFPIFVRRTARFSLWRLVACQGALAALVFGGLQLLPPDAIALPLAVAHSIVVGAYAGNLLLLISTAGRGSRALRSFQKWIRFEMK